MRFSRPVSMKPPAIARRLSRHINPSKKIFATVTAPDRCSTARVKACSGSDNDGWWEERTTKRHKAAKPQPKLETKTLQDPSSPPRGGRWVCEDSSRRRHGAFSVSARGPNRGE